MNIVIYITAADKHLSSLCASKMLVNLFEADTLARELPQSVLATLTQTGVMEKSIPSGLTHYPERFPSLRSLCSPKLGLWKSHLSEADILFTALSPVCVRSAHPNWGYGKVNPFGADTYCIWRIPVVSYCICDSSLFKVNRDTIKFDKYVGDVQVSSSK